MTSLVIWTSKLWSFGLQNRLEWKYELMNELYLDDILTLETSYVARPVPGRDRSG